MRKKKKLKKWKKPELEILITETEKELCLKAIQSTPCNNDIIPPECAAGWL